MDKQAISYETAKEVGLQRAQRGEDTSKAVKGMRTAKARELLANIGSKSSETYNGYGLGKTVIKKKRGLLVNLLGTALGRGYVAAKLLATGKL